MTSQALLIIFRQMPSQNYGCIKMIKNRLGYITEFLAESDLPGQFFMYLNAFTSGLKGVLKNFVICSSLSTNEVEFLICF